jgi:hypothetical protein
MSIQKESILNIKIIGPARDMSREIMELFVFFKSEIHQQIYLNAIMAVDFGTISAEFTRLAVCYHTPIISFFSIP